MKCAILEAPGSIRIDSLPDPEADAGDVVVKVRAALTCGTDLKAYRRGHPKMPCPTPFGHEFSGEIVAVGAGVNDFQVGDAVMSEPALAAGHLRPAFVVLLQSRWRSFARFPSPASP